MTRTTFMIRAAVLGTLGVAAAPMHHPLVLPVMASTLYEMSGGRFSLGLGVSHPEQTARAPVGPHERADERLVSPHESRRARRRRGACMRRRWAVVECSRQCLRRCRSRR